MPRHSRKLSKSEIYHVMIRGNEKKDIFLDDEDKKRIINTLLEKKKTSKFLLYAYCIMNNHAHFIINTKDEPISTVIKRIGTSYAYYYNKKHKRVGHVFQDRFRSENIEDENYLISAVRYVHNNPVKAGICKVPEHYKWSSMNLYLNHNRGVLELPEINEILGIFSDNIDIAKMKFIEFNNCLGKETFIDIDENNKMDQDEVIEYLNNYLNKYKLSKLDLRKLENSEKRNKLIRELFNISSLSGRQISSITGINRETVRKIIMSEEPSP
ncbi:UNVERIFIED_CONTAM: REP element-mobilizing transposase RayT [Acetivibrio alkalicellulosi]